MYNFILINEVIQSVAAVVFVLWVAGAFGRAGK